MSKLKWEGRIGMKGNKAVRSEVSACTAVWGPEKMKPVQGPVSSSVLLEEFSIRNGKVIKMSLRGSTR